MQQGSPAYYLRKTRTNNLRHGAWTKLSRWDVADIRTWARSEGFGLKMSAQIQALQQTYPVSAVTLREVLLNHTWTDLTYDPTVRLDVKTSRVTAGGGSLFWLALLILLGGLCGSALQSDTHTDVD